MNTQWLPNVAIASMKWLGQMSRSRGHSCRGHHGQSAHERTNMNAFHSVCLIALPLYTVGGPRHRIPPVTDDSTLCGR